MNQITALYNLFNREPDMQSLIEDLITHRLNFTDRRVTQLEQKNRDKSSSL